MTRLSPTNHNCCSFIIRRALLGLFLLLNSATTCVVEALNMPRPFFHKLDEETAKQAANLLAAGSSAAVAGLPPLPSQLLRLALAGIVGFGTDPFVQAWFNVTYLEEDNEDVRHTFLYGAADSLSNGARAMGLTLLASLLKQYLGLPVPLAADLLVEVAPQIGFVVWTTLTIATTKRTLLQRAVVNIKGLGRVGLFNKFVDVLLGMGAMANIMKLLRIDLGMGFQSLFAASGVSAIVFSLASRGLVEQIVSGFLLQAWDAIEEGEEIRLGDGTEGTVKYVGLMETVIVDDDDVATRIPNAEIASQRVASLSDVKKSHFKQILRFKYSDLSKIPAVLEAIKQEIQAQVSADDLITDGSRPFRAVLTQYEPDHVQAQITCNFNLKPGSSGFIEARQQVLLAIAHAVAQSSVEFAIPSIRYQTGDGNGNDYAAVAGDIWERPKRRIKESLVQQQEAIGATQ